MLTRHGLTRFRARALRQRVWFKALSKTERCIVDLTIRCVDRIRSRVLARMVSDIVAKILRTLKPSFLETAMRVGSEIADEVCAIALKWGNVHASKWKHHAGFIKFLGINAVNGTIDVRGQF